MNTTDELERLRNCFLAEVQALDRALDFVRELNGTLSMMVAMESQRDNEPILLRMDPRRR